MSTAGMLDVFLERDASHLECHFLQKDHELEHLEKRGLSEVDVTFLYKLSHVSEEEREKKYLNVRAVYVGVGHYYNLP